MVVMAAPRAGDAVLLERLLDRGVEILHVHALLLGDVAQVLARGQLRLQVVGAHPELVGDGLLDVGRHLVRALGGGGAAGGAYGVDLHWSASASDRALVCCESACARGM